MLGILLIYFIGKAFYDLAAKYDRTKLLFAFIGVASYYAGTFIAGLIFGFLIETGMMEPISEVALIFIALPSGILVCVSLYYILKNYFSKNKIINNDEEILDTDFTK